MAEKIVHVKYRCSFCKKEYEKEELADHCEKLHMDCLPVRIEVSKYSQVQAEPNEIVVHFKNGMTGKYVYVFPVYM